MRALRRYHLSENGFVENSDRAVCVISAILIEKH